MLTTYRAPRRENLKKQFAKSRGISLAQMNAADFPEGGNRLSAAETASYGERGYVIPAMCLWDARLAALDDAVEYLLAANPHVPPEALMSVHIVDNKAENRCGHQAFLDRALDPALLDIVEQVIGADIVLWGCHLFCKPGETGREVPWHQDGKYWPIRPLATCTLWLALDEANSENGCMHVIPGSHAEKRLYRHHEDANPALALYQVLDADQFDADKAVDIALLPGQFSLHDIYMVHGSTANRSGKRRAGLAIRYMPATSLFDRSIGPRDTGARTGDPRYANFADRPTWLARGVDRTDCHGGNDFSIGHV